MTMEDHILAQKTREKCDDKDQDSSLKRQSFRMDKIDEHYERLPWVLGALGRVLGIRFAPVNIPLERRLQTFAVFHWMSTFLFMGFGSLFLLIYLLLYTQYWWVTAVYYAWFMGDRQKCNQGGRRCNWIRNWKLWKHYANFFPIQLVKTAELDPSKKLHNGVPSSWNFVSWCILQFFYRRDKFLKGAVSVKRESMDYILTHKGTGAALCLVVGGAKESLDSHPGEVILHLRRRKGFVKMALHHGASLVPVFSFGENDIYDQVANPEGSWVRWAQDGLQKYIGLAPCLFMGRGIFQYSFGIVPYRRPITTVVGKPIDVPQVVNPTDELVSEYHSKYVEALVAVYNLNKLQYSRTPEVKIQII